jgi:predicted transcriptional regulator
VLRNTSPFWKLPENAEMLNRLYLTASWQELLAAFPGKSKVAIHNAAKRLGYRRIAVCVDNVAKDPLMKALQQRRIALGLSQVALSVQLGYARKFVQECESGHKNLSITALRKWAKALGMVLVAAVPQTRAAVVSAMQEQARLDMAEWQRRRVA